MKQVKWVLVLVLLFSGLTTSVVAQEGKTVPASYDEVAGLYSEMEETVVSDGEAAIAPLVSGDIDAFYALFGPNMQATITRDTFGQGYDELIEVAPIGEQVAYRVTPLGNTLLYSSLHTWSDGWLKFDLIMDTDGTIIFLNQTPLMPLPDDPAAESEIAVTFRFPFDGLWYTSWGGPDELLNYHVVTPSQRHAFDFLVWKDGSTYTGDGTVPEDFYAYGQPLLAPADGTVVTVVDGWPDVQPYYERDEKHPLGNHVVIQVADDAYLFIAHLQAGSLLVAEGDTVVAGQEIGRVGNSGNTTEPHIHIHLQNTPEAYTYDDEGNAIGFTEAISLPLKFSDYLADGEPVEIGEPLGEQFVQTAP